MARIAIFLDVDIDPTIEDPHEVAEEVLLQDVGGYGSGVAVRDFAGNPVLFHHAEWVKD